MDKATAIYYLNGLDMRCVKFILSCNLMVIYFNDFLVFLSHKKGFRYRILCIQLIKTVLYNVYFEFEKSVQYF